jgi:arsenite methyltransferase
LILAKVGFEGVRIDVKEDSRAFISKWAPGVGAEDFIAAANIYATKK